MWPRPKCFILINNFGFGGTNAHTVLKRALFLEKNGSESAESILYLKKLFVLSVNKKFGLKILIKNIGIYLKQRPEVI